MAIKKTHEQFVLDIINEAFKTSLYGCGRGSAGAFYLLYLIGIVLLNPLVSVLFLRWRQGYFG